MKTLKNIFLFVWLLVRIIFAVVGAIMILYYIIGWFLYKNSHSYDKYDGLDYCETHICRY